MKLRIFTKLFLAMLLSLFIPLGLMMASVHWSFRQGFSDYLHQVELERVGKLVGLLSQAYREHGSWEFLKNNRHRWSRLVWQGLEEKAEASDGAPSGEPHHFPPPPFEEMAGHDQPFHGAPPEGFPPPPGMPPPHGRPPPPLRDPFMLGLRLRLFDVDRHPVVLPPPDLMANRQNETMASMLPVVVDDATVGWLGVQRSNIVSDRLALAFVGQQSRSNLLILILAFSAATLASLILARQIIRPLRRIAGGTKTLASGHYDVSLPISSDELGDLARDFNLLALTLKRNEQARRQWVADISHELRTPVAVLRGETEALMDGIRQPSPDRIGSLHGEVLSLSKLVDDLYELSLSDLGALNYRRDAVDLTEALTVAADSFRGRFEDKAIRLALRVDGAASMHGDRQRLMQLFANLLENTYRHTDRGGRCEIGLKTSTEAITVTIDDSAPGVPAEALDKLFDRLFRVDGARSREHGGAGLGLAICKNIVEAHGGRIAAHTSRLGGLCIRIDFPGPTG